MYRLLIVDDERSIRDGLAATIPWETYGYEVVGAAANGQQALDMVSKTRPHVVLTDIRMPIMDGIEFMKALKRNHGPQPKVVLLSAFDDFERCREGLNLGASAYVRKISVESEISGVLTELSDDLSTEVARATEEERDRIRHMVQAFLLFGGTDSQRKTEVAKRHADDMVIVAVAHLETDDGIREDREQHWARFSSVVRECWRPSLSRFHGTWILLQFKENEHVLVRLHTGMSDEAFTDSSLAHVRELSECSPGLYDAGGPDPVIGVSRTYRGIANLNAAYHEARHLATSYPLGRSRRVVTLADTQPAEIRNRGHVEQATIERDLVRSVELGSRQHAQEHAQSWLDHVTGRPYATRSTLRHDCDRVFSVLHWRLAAAGTSALAEEPPRADPDASPDGIVRWFWRTLSDYLITVEVQREGGKSLDSKIDLLKRYVSDHLDGSISLAEMARWLCLDSSYLSDAFHKKTGLTFREYLAQARIDQARKALRQGLTVRDAALSVGYHDLKHFRKLYKRVTGENPGQTRVNEPPPR
jgi:YesN/AraC family two-component response regulator